MTLATLATEVQSNLERPPTRPAHGQPRSRQDAVKEGSPWVAGDRSQPKLPPSRIAPTVRRCACGGIVGASGECAACRSKRLQRLAVDGGTPHAPPGVREVLRSSGRPLEPAVRCEMQSRLGHDFADVRVHTDPRAAESAREVGALAYTVGRDVVFGEGRYRPHSSEGRQILVHEMVHVIQQNSAAGPATGELRVDAPGSPAEREAGAVAAGTSQRIGVAQARPSLQRLGANPGCTAAQAADIHQAIFDARGWLNKVIPQLGASPLSATVLASLRRNFGPTFGVAANAGLIAGRLRVAYQELSKNPFGCDTPAGDAQCANACGLTVAGSHASTICTNITLTAPVDAIFRAGCVLHESLHAAFTGFTVDQYSGWHGHSSQTATYPGAGTDPLLNADSYTSLVIDLS